MNANGFIRLIDAGFGGGLVAELPGVDDRRAPLMPDTGEYCVALRRLAESGPGGPAGCRVPDEVFLHLYTYELLERMREQAHCHGAGMVKVIVLPFWPASLFAASGLAVHGAREIMALFPPAERTFYARRPEIVLVNEARRVLGGVGFEPRAYLDAMDAAARRNRWIHIEETG